jgi:uncharacterized protein
MPPISEKQRKAMYAAAEGHPNIGIPQAVGEEFTAKDAEPTAAAGVMIFDPDGHALFLRRSGEGDHPGEWCWPGGGVDPGETPESAARREVEEETGHQIDGKLILAHHNKGDVDFTTFAHQTPTRFEPRLNDEHSEHVWARPESPPQPLHPGVAATLQRYNGGAAAEAKDCGAPAMDAAIALALDRSNRNIDGDGHLRAKHNLLTRAEVSPYRGEEINAVEPLGLDPDRIYYLYRLPEELKKGAVTLEGKPILIKHKPISSDDHPEDLVVGAVNNPEIVGDELYGDISVWTREAVDAILNGSKKHISLGYHYKPVMERGIAPNGQKFDGVMKNIRYNHLALVDSPRIKDAVVADSADELLWARIEQALNTILLT